MYGDHLYKKGDFEGAMQQYRNTIGHLDPSYVIRRFLDAQRIGLLTSYLEALHDAGQASSDHTTLLLNCHTKLKVCNTPPESGATCLFTLSPSSTIPRSRAHFIFEF